MTGIKEDAEREMDKFAKEGWSVVYIDDVQDDKEERSARRQNPNRIDVIEVPITKQECIIGPDGKKTIKTITTKTIVTTSKDKQNYELPYDTPDFSGTIVTTKNIPLPELDDAK